jgi:two-component system sensor histidine kinase CpxA
MKPRFPLSTKIFLLAFRNLALLGLLFLGFARYGLHVRFNSVLTAPAEDRVLSLARQLALDLGEAPASGRGSILQRYAKAYGVSFYLFLSPATQIAGPPVSIPDPVMEEIRRPPPRREGPPPGRGREEGPPPQSDRPPPPAPLRSGPGQPQPTFEVTTGNPTMYWVGARIPIRSADTSDDIPGLVLIASPSFLGTPLLFDYRPWLIVSGAIIAISVLCWLPFIRSLTRDVSRLHRVTERIVEGHFDDRVAEDRGDELGLLAAEINRMATRLSGFVHGQKRFLGDIAHELCAPISRMQFGLGILEHRAEPEQREAVGDLQEEMQQMSGLVEELLSFSKAGMRPGAKPLVPVEIAGTVRQAIAREALADSQIEFAIPAGLAAMADADYLVRAISNLLRNAVRYAGDRGPVTVTARRDREEVLINVADHGPGLPENEIDRVFTPFYRIETSRSREAGGVGLGLAIVRSCVEACKGSVRCRNLVPSGLEVEIRLPAAASPQEPAVTRPPVAATSPPSGA